jgi:hypothetical protein
VQQTKTAPDSGPESANSPTISTPDAGWFKVGFLAAASALAGGLAVEWYYRNTLTRLSQSEDPEEDARRQEPREREGSGI